MKKIALLLSILVFVLNSCDNNYYHDNVCKMSLINKYYQNEKIDLYIYEKKMSIKREYTIYNENNEPALVIEYNIPQKFVEMNNKAGSVEFKDNNNISLYRNDNFFVNGGFHFIFRVTENKTIEKYEYKIYSDNWDKIELDF